MCCCETESMSSRISEQRTSNGCTSVPQKILCHVEEKKRNHPFCNKRKRDSSGLEEKNQNVDDNDADALSNVVGRISKTEFWDNATPVTNTSSSSLSSHCSYDKKGLDGKSSTENILKVWDNSSKELDNNNRGITCDKSSQLSVSSSSTSLSSSSQVVDYFVSYVDGSILERNSTDTTLETHALPPLPSSCNEKGTELIVLDRKSSTEHSLKHGENSYNNSGAVSEQPASLLESSPSSFPHYSQESNLPSIITVEKNDSCESLKLSGSEQSLNKVRIALENDSTKGYFSNDLKFSFNDEDKVLIRGVKREDPLLLLPLVKQFLLKDQFIVEDLSSKRNISTSSALNLLLPSHNNLPISPPRKLQVNYVAARLHPHHVHGIPWKFLKYERYRLMSFVKFPSDSPTSTIILAAKGFAYLDDGPGHMIICFFCATKCKVLDDMSLIDKEHEQFGMNCPMVRGTHCSNISMKNQCPNLNADEIFSQLLARGQDENRIKEPAASPLSVDGTPNNARSSQPSDQSASYVIVTNTSDLAESDSTVQNSGQTLQSSQMMEDSVSSAEQVESVTTSHSPSSAQVSATIDESSATVEGSSRPQGNSTATDSNTQHSTMTDDSSAHPNSSVIEDTSAAVNNAQQEQSNDNKDENEGEATSYEKLGIITARPKRVEYAVYATRFNTFNEWPKGHHIKPIDLAKAGYFYTGYSDCARCFYCGGGLRNWEEDDDVWVEHARWFPKCAFLLQEVGKDFIDTVIAISKERDQIKYADVIERMQGSGTPTPLKFKERVIERDPAVLSVVDNGYDKYQVMQLAQEIRKGGELLSSDKLYEAAKQRKLVKNDSTNNLGSDSVSIKKGGNESRDKEMIETLRTENNELRQQTMCKICMDMEVAVVFLPCGHLVSCTECSCALTVCPLCRFGIKGIVRAYVG